MMMLVLDLPTAQQHLDLLATQHLQTLVLVVGLSLLVLVVGNCLAGDNESNYLGLHLDLELELVQVMICWQSDIVLAIVWWGAVP